MDLTGKRLLVVKPSSLGDVVHTLPLVHAIKRCYPSCYIGWIVQKSLSAILEYDPSVDEIVPIAIPSTSDPTAHRDAFVHAAIATFRTWRQLRHRFKEKPYDVVLDLHASFRSGLLQTANPGGFRIGFADAKEFNTYFQDHTLSPDPSRPHAVDENLSFAEYLRCPPQPGDFRVLTSDAARERVRMFLEKAGVKEGSRIVYANPGARWKTKQWTIGGWSKLAELLIRKVGATVIFSGSPDDAPHIQSITDLMTERALNAAGSLSLSDAVALIEASDVYVGVDSGPMHIAAFVGTPVVAILGPTEPAKVGPYGQGHRVFRREDLDCLACRKRSCKERFCMERIGPEEVFDATVHFLGC
jgi:lipopolysaccharide heptosyltransferase II